MSFNPLKTPVDHIILSGQRSPGIAELSGFSIPKKWQELSGMGFSGGFVLYRGRKVSKGTVRIRLYSDADWIAWDLFVPLLRREPRSRQPKAQSIWHPWLQMLGIKSVVVEDLKQPVEIDNGGYAFDIKMIEFRQPKRRLAKPKGAEEKEKKLDPVEQEIQDNSEQIEALAPDLF